MILQCPECNAKFKIPEGALGESGRGVKCGKCAHLWHAMPDGVALSQQPVLVQDKTTTNEAPDIDKVLAGRKHTSEPSVEDALGSYKPPKKVVSRKRYWMVMGSAYAVLLVLIAGLWSLKHAPDMWGQQDSGGFAFEQINIEPMPQLGGERFTMNKLYKISGRIRNTSDAAKMVPPIRVTLLDSQGNAVYSRVSEDKETLPPGETIDFLRENLEQPDPSHTHFVVEMGSKLELALRSVELEDAH